MAGIQSLQPIATSYHTPFYSIIFMVLTITCLIPHSKAAAIHPSSLVLQGSAQCDAKNRDPCSTFPGLCSTGGGLCVLKGPCEYQCVCPPDGRRGRDCTGRDDVINTQREEITEPSNTGSLLDSLLVFPQDLFWDLNHVLRPEESVKMMQSTPSPPSPMPSLPSLPSNILQNTDSNVTSTNQASQIASNSTNLSDILSNGNDDNIDNNTSTSTSLASNAVTGGNITIEVFVNLPNPTEQESAQSQLPSNTAIDTTPSTSSSSSPSAFPLSSSTTSLPSSSLSPSSLLLSSLSSSSTTTPKTTMSGMHMALQNPVSEKAPMTPNNNRHNLNNQVFTDLDTTNLQTDGTPAPSSDKPDNNFGSTPSTIPDSISQKSVKGGGQTNPDIVNPPQSIVTSRIPVVPINPDQQLTISSNPAQTSPQPAFAVPKSSKTKNSPPTPTKPAMKDVMTLATNSPKMSLTPIITSTFGVKNPDSTTVNPLPINNGLNARELFPGHESFPTFFRDVVEDNGKDDDAPNMAMNKRVHRIFFPIPQFEKIDRRSGDGLGR